MNQITIGKFIAQKRKEKNLTQEQLAEKLGVSNKTVSKWELLCLHFLRCSAERILEIFCPD